MNNGAPVNGHVSLVLRLYSNSVPSAGEALLYEDSNVVAVADGVYDTFLGDDTTAGSLLAALMEPEVYLDVDVNGAPLLPRRRLVANPYALRAKDTALLQGSGGSGLARLAADNAWSGSNSFGGDLTVGGPLGVAVMQDLIVRGRPTVDGAMTVFGELAVSSNLNLAGPLVTLGDVHVFQGTEATEDAILRGNNFSDGDLTVLGEVTVGQNAQVDTNLLLLADATVNQSLTVNQDLIVRGDNFTDGRLDLMGDLHVGLLGGQGFGELFHDAIVHGNIDAKGSWGVGGDLAVNGGAEFSHDAIWRGNTFSDGGLHVVGNLTVDGLYKAQNDTKEYVITDYGAVGDGLFDNASIFNEIIDKMPASGGTIVVPHGEFRVNSPIVVNKSFVTIRGLNYGQRSSNDTPPKPGEFTGGGSQIPVGVASGDAAILVPDLGSAPRIVGLTIRDLNFGGFGGASGQNAIKVDHPTDGLTITRVVAKDVSFGIFVRAGDRTTITDCWLAELGLGLRMTACIEGIVANNHFGGQPHDISCEFVDSSRMTFHGNLVFPDGYTCLRLLNTFESVVEGNQFNTPYTGLLEVTGSGNTIVHNSFKAHQVSGAWAGDPAGRDGLWGLVRIDGNDNNFSFNNIESEQPVDDTRLHIVNGVNNHIASNNIWGFASAHKVVMGSGTLGTRVIYCSGAGEWEDFADPGDNFVVNF